MFILKKGHQPGVYVPLRALFLVLVSIGTEHLKAPLPPNSCNPAHLSSIIPLWIRGGTLSYLYLIYEPRREKTGFLHMRKQRRRSASR